MEDAFFDEKKLEQLQLQQEKKWEALCSRCGACCGIADGDPCEHLMSSSDGKYFCDIYKNRCGTRKTRGGRVFQCVPIRDILHDSWPGDRCCGYKKSSV